MAACFLTPDDPRPSIVIVQEMLPGKSPYTRGSEIMNAETSAWDACDRRAPPRRYVEVGRVRDEVEAPCDDDHDAAPVERQATDSQRYKLERGLEERGVPDGVPYPVPPVLTMREASRWIDLVFAQPARNSSSGARLYRPGISRPESGRRERPAHAS